MSYDIMIVKKDTDDIMLLPYDAVFPKEIRQGTYAVGGSPLAVMNITYNYAPIFVKVLGPQGVRTIYGMRAFDTILLLTEAIDKLGTDVHEDYWEPTEGNARQALVGLRYLAANCPLGYWTGD